MIVYKNPFVTYPCYFIKTGKAHTGRNEASASSGYEVYQRKGEWCCVKTRYYDKDLKTGGYMQIVGETRYSIQTVIDNAIINAVLDAVNEGTI